MLRCRDVEGLVGVAVAPRGEPAPVGDLGSDHARDRDDPPPAADGHGERILGQGLLQQSARSSEDGERTAGSVGPGFKRQPPSALENVEVIPTAIRPRG